MELYGEGGHVLVIQPFAGAIVTVDEAQGGIGRQRLRVYGKAVILAGHIAPSGYQILGGLVGAPVAIF